MSSSMSGSNLQNEQWIRHMAKLEDEHPSISVGGMVAELGLVNRATSNPSGVFARFVEFARRKDGLTLEELARRAGIELAELVAIERGSAAKPNMATVHQLAKYLRLPPEPLLELAGLSRGDSAIGPAAIRFAAQSESSNVLSPHERAAFDEFVKAIANTAST